MGTTADGNHALVFAPRQMQVLGALVLLGRMSIQGGPKHVIEAMAIQGALRAVQDGGAGAVMEVSDIVGKAASMQLRARVEELTGQETDEDIKEILRRIVKDM